MDIHSTLLERLRAETRAQHDKIEGCIVLPLSLDQYRVQLEKFWGFVHPLERRLAATLGSDSRLLLGREKAPLLEADLRALARSADIAELNKCQDLPSSAHPPECLGILYVLEGSTLGGRIIAAHLETTFGADVPSRYYKSYGPDVMRRWSEFKGLLNAAAEPAHYDQVVRSAQETFSKLHAWFAGCPASS